MTGGALSGGSVPFGFVWTVFSFWFLVFSNTARTRNLVYPRRAGKGRSTSFCPRRVAKGRSTSFCPRRVAKGREEHLNTFLSAEGHGGGGRRTRGAPKPFLCPGEGDKGCPSGRTGEGAHKGRPYRCNSRGRAPARGAPTDSPGEGTHKGCPYPIRFARGRAPTRGAPTRFVLPGGGHPQGVPLPDSFCPGEGGAHKGCPCPIRVCPGEGAHKGCPYPIRYALGRAAPTRGAPARFVMPWGGRPQGAPLPMYCPGEGAHKGRPYRCIARGRAPTRGAPTFVLPGGGRPQGVPLPLYCPGEGAHKGCPYRCIARGRAPTRGAPTSCRRRWRCAADPRCWSG